MTDYTKFLTEYARDNLAILLLFVTMKQTKQTIRKIEMKTSFCCILAILFVALHAQSAIYVKPGATGGGTSWADAADLEAALAQVQLSGGDVYVAKGFYQPSATLMIANGVSVYGGFAGVDSGETPQDFHVSTTMVGAMSTTRSTEMISFSVLTSAIRTRCCSGEECIKRPLS